jgi:four helix bundle protein
MHVFKELKVWQKSRVLVREVYILTKEFPKAELYGITSQIRRSVISIPSNIAEGAGRNTSKEFLRYLDISLGSSYELETQLILSSDLNFLKIEQYEKLIADLSEIQKMIIGLMQSLKKKSAY